MLAYLGRRLVVVWVASKPWTTVISGIRAPDGAVALEVAA